MPDASIEDMIERTYNKAIELVCSKGGKVKPALSAGRVQSVAVRLIVEREREIHAFKRCV